MPAPGLESAPNYSTDESTHRTFQSARRAEKPVDEPKSTLSAPRSWPSSFRSSKRGKKAIVASYTWYISPRNRLIVVQSITPLNAFVFKAVRLDALQEAPGAFGSTYEKELRFPDSEWLARVERMNGERGIGFLAMEGETPCGIVGSFLDENDPTRAHLVSMWTAPTHRQQGAGRQLVKEVVRWACLRHARTLLLMVTSNNEPALRFYERLGFARTGRTEPYPNDPAILEYEMSRPIP
jgi:ribosomal protein S18 acetylase RimI-like enzyme